MSVETAAEVQWRLHPRMAEVGIRFASDLHRRLVEVMGDQAPSQDRVRSLLRETPVRLNLRTLGALCVVLDCAPGDLLAMQPPARSASPGPSEDEVSDKLAMIEKGQQLAGHFPTENDLAAARRILTGQSSYEQEMAGFADRFAE